MKKQVNEKKIAMLKEIAEALVVHDCWAEKWDDSEGFINDEYHYWHNSRSYLRGLIDAYNIMFDCNHTICSIRRTINQI